MQVAAEIPTREHILFSDPYDRVDIKNVDPYLRNWLDCRLDNFPVRASLLDDQILHLVQTLFPASSIDGMAFLKELCKYALTCYIKPTDSPDSAFNWTAVIRYRSINDLLEQPGWRWGRETTLKVLQVLEVMTVIQRYRSNGCTSIYMPLGPRILRKEAIEDRLQACQYKNKKTRQLLDRLARCIQTYDFQCMHIAQSAQATGLRSESELEKILNNFARFLKKEHVNWAICDKLTFWLEEAFFPETVKNYLKKGRAHHLYELTVPSKRAMIVNVPVSSSPVYNPRLTTVDDMCQQESGGIEGYMTPEYYHRLAYSHTDDTVNQSDDYQYERQLSDDQSQNMLPPDIHDEQDETLDSPASPLETKKGKAHKLSSGQSSQPEAGADSAKTIDNSEFYKKSPLSLSPRRLAHSNEKTERSTSKIQKNVHRRQQHTTTPSPTPSSWEDTDFPATSYGQYKSVTAQSSQLSSQSDSGDQAQYYPSDPQMEADPYQSIPDQQQVYPPQTWQGVPASLESDYPSTITRPSQSSATRNEMGLYQREKTYDARIAPQKYPASQPLSPSTSNVNTETDQSEQQQRAFYRKLGRLYAESSKLAGERKLEDYKLKKIQQYHHALKDVRCSNAIKYDAIYLYERFYNISAVKPEEREKHSSLIKGFAWRLLENPRITRFAVVSVFLQTYFPDENGSPRDRGSRWFFNTYKSYLHYANLIASLHKQYQSALLAGDITKMQDLQDNYKKHSYLEPTEQIKGWADLPLDFAELEEAIIVEQSKSDPKFKKKYHPYAPPLYQVLADEVIKREISEEEIEAHEQLERRMQCNLLESYPKFSLAESAAVGLYIPSPLKAEQLAVVEEVTASTGVQIEENAFASSSEPSQPSLVDNEGYYSHNAEDVYFEENADYARSFEPDSLEVRDYTENNVLPPAVDTQNINANGVSQNTSVENKVEESRPPFKHTFTGRYPTLTFPYDTGFTSEAKALHFLHMLNHVLQTIARVEIHETDWGKFVLLAVPFPEHMNSVCLLSEEDARVVLERFHYLCSKTYYFPPLEENEKFGDCLENDEIREYVRQNKSVKLFDRPVRKKR